MYAVAGEFVEVVMEVSWSDALETVILWKFGLSQSSVMESEIPVPSMALPYAILDHKTQWRVGDVKLTDETILYRFFTVMNHPFISLTAFYLVTASSTNLPHLTNCTEYVMPRSLYQHSLEERDPTQAWSKQGR